MGGIQKPPSDNDAVKSEPTLNHNLFATSRLMEFCTEKQLTMQIGQQPEKLSLKEAVFSVMEEASSHAGGNKTDPANARPVMYTAHHRVPELTGGNCRSHSSYFTQRLLPEFIEANPELTKVWEVVFDARGRLVEPHTGRRIDLGTLEVRNHIRRWTTDFPDGPPRVIADARCPTRGPTRRYRFALFVQKEGYYPLPERRRVADRFDAAIMFPKGMTVTAARELVDRLSGQGVTVLVLRDFDTSGFSIFHTQRANSCRYNFRSKPKVIGIALRLEVVRDCGLLPLPGPADYRNANKDPREALRVGGAAAAEPVIPRCGGVGQ
jgi:hypothetical protein